jgi:copper transport protein
VKRLIAAGVAVALLLPAAAYAHASLVGRWPGIQQRLQHAPRLVRIEFDQSVQLPAIEVLDSSGRNYAGTAVAHGTTITAPVRRLPTGAYTVRWHALSADSHVVTGVWTFGVRVAAPPATEAYGASGPTTTENVVRWLYFLSLALLIGSLGFRLLCLRGGPVPAAVEKRIYLVAGIGVIGVLELGILAFCLRAEDVLQLPFGKFLYGDLSPLSSGTRFGTAFIVMTLAYAVIAAIVFLSWLLDRVALLVPALVLAILFASGLSLSGHDAVDVGSSWKTELADWVHLSAGSLWIGGLVTMLVVWGAAQGVRRDAFTAFSQLATVLIALVLAAGTYLGIVRLPHLHDLWTTGYGHVLLVKISLVAVALTWGAVHHFVVRPRLADAGEAFFARVGRSMLGESAVGIAVLLAAAVLTDSKPPPQPVPATVTQPAAHVR